MAYTVSVKWDPSSTWDGYLYASNGTGGYNYQSFNHMYDVGKTKTIQVMENDFLIAKASNNASPHGLYGGSGMYTVVEHGTGIGNSDYAVVYKVTQSTSCTFS